MLNAPWTKAVADLHRDIGREFVHRPRLRCNRRVMITGIACELVFNFRQCHAGGLQLSHSLNTGEMRLRVLGSASSAHWSGNETSADVVANGAFRHAGMLRQLIQTDVGRRLALLGPVHENSIAYVTVSSSVVFILSTAGAWMGIESRSLGRPLRRATS